MLVEEVMTEPHRKVVALRAPGDGRGDREGRLLGF
jgi:hypothetical protein